MIVSAALTIKLALQTISLLPFTCILRDLFAKSGHNKLWIRVVINGGPLNVSFSCVQCFISRNLI